MREHQAPSTRVRTKVAAVVAVGLSVALGTVVLGASPADACPGHVDHPPVATE